MNQVQMIALLDTLSISFFYGQAPVGTVLPFGVIHSDQPDNFVADNIVYCEKWDFRLDLYSAEKSLALEAEIKGLLNENDIPWEKTELYLDDQSCWEVEFTFTVAGNEDIPEPEPEPQPPTPDDEGGDGDGS